MIPVRQLKKYLHTVVVSGGVPLVLGSPGSSKSSQIKQYAKKANMKVIDIRLSQLESYDLLGLVHINKKGRLDFAPPSNIPLEGDKLPKGYDSWLLFLDELLMADEHVLKAAMKLIYDRQVGDFKLHDKVTIMCASNRPEDNAGVTVMNSALSNRLTHLNLDEMTFDDWSVWANKNNIDDRILAYLSHNEDHLSVFNPEETINASPRSWTTLSRQIKNQKDADDFLFMLAIGNVGLHVATPFYTFCSKLIGIDIDKIISTGVVPDQLDIQYYIVTMLLKLKDIKKKHINLVTKLDSGVALLFVKNRLKVDPSIIKHKAISKLLK